MKIGLIGAGRIGQIHAKSICSHPVSDLVAIADVDTEAATQLAQKVGAHALSVQDMLADKSIKAVLIASSTDTHADLIEEVTAAGKAVLCEKPVELNLARAKRCLAIANQNGQPVMIGFNRRFDPNFIQIKMALDAGEIGQAELLSVTSFDPKPPPTSYIQVSGGLFRDMAIHDFDMVHWLYGAKPVRMHAMATCLVDQSIAAAGDVDTAIITMQFADGRLAVIKNSRRAAYGYDQRLELLGSKGLLQAQNVLEHTVQKITAEGAISAKPQHFFLERYRAAYIHEWTAFMDALQGDKPMPVSVADGVVALEMAEAAIQSLQSGVPVVL